MKSNLFLFIEGQTYFSTSGHTKMSSTLDEAIKNVLRSNLHTTSKHAPKTCRSWKILFAKQPTPDENVIELKENSITPRENLLKLMLRGLLGLCRRPTPLWPRVGQSGEFGTTSIT